MARTRPVIVPNPGSPEAQLMGCTCPVMDNYYGKGYMGIEGSFVMSGGCPVHSTEEAIKRLTLSRHKIGEENGQDDNA